MAITLRNIKGSPLTHDEMDENFSALTSSLGAGDGLTGGGFLTSEVEFNVGQGDGISVGPDSVGVDATVARTGSNVFVGDQTITGSIYLTGSLVHDGIINLLPTEPPSPSSDPQSFIYVSGSEGDLYFRQTSSRGTNETKLRWLEGNLFSGILSGGVISGTPGGTTFSVSAGSGIIVDINASTGSLDLYPIITKVEWDDFSNITPTYLTTDDTTWLLIDSSGTLVQQTNPPTDAQYNSTITLGAVIHPNKTTINLFKTFPLTSYALAQQTYEFIRVFGPIKKSGHIISPGASSLTVSRSSGTAFALGRNYVNNPNEPSLIADDAKSEATIYRYYQSGSEFVTVPNNATIDPTKYNTPSTATGLTTVAGGKYTIQRVFFFPDAPNILAVYYGRETYNSIAAALENLNYEPFVEINNTIEQAIFLGYIIVKGNATDLTDDAQALFLQSGNFRATVTSGGGGSPVVASLNDLSDVSLASLTSGDLLVYNGAEWQNRKNNLKVTGSFSGSFQGTTIDVTSASFDRLDVLGSSTINGDLTVDGKVTAQEFHTEFVSASIIYQSGSTKFGDTLDDIHEFTGSVNITGSLTSIGATTLTGDVDLTGDLNVDGDITGSSNLDIAGTVDANVYSINGTTVVDSSRNITGSAGTFSGTVDVSNLDSTNNVNANTFSINGSTVINSSQDITGASLDVTGEVEGNSVAIDGTTVIDASRNITGASLDVSGEVEGNSFAINTTTVIDSSQNITGASLDVTGNADANTFSIDDTVVVDASRNITGSNATLSGTLFVDGNTTIDANLSASGNLDVDGTGRVDGNLRTQGQFSINASPSSNVSITVIDSTSNGSILDAQNTVASYGTFLNLLTDTYNGSTNFDFISIGVNNSSRATDPKDAVFYMYQDNDWNIWANNTKILRINSDGLNLLEGNLTASNDIYAGGNISTAGNADIDGTLVVLGSTELGDSSTNDTHSITGLTSVTGSFAVDNITLDGQQISSLVGDLELNSQGVVDIKTNITASGNNLEFNHTGTGNFTFSSENGNILIESTQFSGDDVIVAGNIAVNGGDITTTDTTANIFNANATSLNLAGAATSIEIGSTSGTTSINHDLTVDGNTTLGNADADRVDILGQAVALSGSNVTFQHDSPNGELRIQTLGGTNNKLILSSSGDIEIEQSMTMKNLDTSFQSVGYQSGFAGQGFDINFTSQSSAEFDNLTVRGSMRVFELIINQIRATNGSLFVSSVGKVDSVVDLGGGEYALIFDTGSGTVGHGFAENDVIRSQQVDRSAIGEAGVTQSLQGSLVYRSDLTVTSVQDLKVVTASLDPGSTPPSSSFDYVRLGNTTNINRQGNVYLTSDDNYAPFIDVVDGITDHDDWNNSAVSGGVKVRVGKIDGINSPQFGDLSGYGMWASGSVYLEGSVNATGGLIGGWAIEPGYLESNNIRLQSSGSAGGELIKIGSAASMTGNGVYLSGSGEFNLQADTNEYIRQSNNLLDIKSSEFSLSTGQLTISGSSSNGFISLGTLTDANTVSNTNAGFFVSSSGDILLKGNIANNKYIKVQAGGGVEIKSDDFDLLAGSLALVGNSTNSYIKIGSLTNATTVGTTNSGFYADNSGNVLIKGSSNGSNYLKIDGSGTIDINSDNFTLTGGTDLKLTNDAGGLLTFGDTVYSGASVAISGSGEAKFGNINVDGRSGGSIFSGTTNINSTTEGLFLSGSGEFNFVKDSNNYIRRVGDQFELAATTASLSGENVIINVSNLDINTPTFDLSTDNGGTIALGLTPPTNLSSNGIFLSGSGEFNFQLDPDNRITLDGSTLDLRAENLVAKGDSVEISGSNFHLLNGNITASNVDLSGNINAQTGTIGGFTIDTDLQAGSGLLTLKGASGEITGSQVLFTGGKISGSNLEINVENFTALGNSVEISGSNFHLLNGNITASNVDLSGNINAQTGTIGGFNITEDALSSNIFFLSGSATGNEFFISSSKFNVKANGDVTASNATITGDITATNITAINQGNIAGFTLSSDQLVDSNTGTSLVLKSNGQITGSNVLFTGGKISGSAIEFDVTNFVAKGDTVEISGSSFHLLNGNITASNVDLSGKINAESGTIGGFTIGNGVLNSGTNFFISGSATGAEYFISSSKFHVTADGALTADDATLSGTSEADSFLYSIIVIDSGNKDDYIKLYGTGTKAVLDLSGGPSGSAQFIRVNTNITQPITHIIPPKAAGASNGFRVVIERGAGSFSVEGGSGAVTLDSGYTVNYNGGTSVGNTVDINNDSDGGVWNGLTTYTPVSGERLDFIKSANDYKLQSTNKFQYLYVNGGITGSGINLTTLPSLSSETTGLVIDGSNNVGYREFGDNAFTSFTNGADNRVITATGASGMNAEANLTFDGSLLTVTGNSTVTGILRVDDYARIDALRVGTTSTDPGDGNLYVEGSATIAGGLTVTGNNILFNSTDGDFSVMQKVSAWTNSTAHPIIRWDYNTTYSDNIALFSGGNSTLTSQAMLMVSETLGLAVGTANPGTTDFGDNLFNTIGFTVSKAGAVSGSSFDSSGNTTIRGNLTVLGDTTISGDVSGHPDITQGSNISINGSNGTVIQDLTITLDENGHVTTSTAGTVNLDGRYYTETESDNRFVNVSGDSMTGTLAINGTLLKGGADVSADTSVETIESVATATYDAAFFDFVIKNGSNLRAGTVYAVHDGTNVEFTETSTQDLGDTSDVTLSVDISGGNLRLRASTVSNGWTIKAFVRGL